jgi:hypothetical protein
MKRTTEKVTTPRNPTKVVSALRVAKSRATKSTKTPEVSATMLSDTHIAMRAYEIFKARNGEPGDPLSDWLQAERELARPHPAVQRERVEQEHGARAAPGVAVVHLGAVHLDLGHDPWFTTARGGHPGVDAGPVGDRRAGRDPAVSCQPSAIGRAQGRGAES